MEILNNLQGDYEATKLRVLAHLTKIYRSGQGLEAMQRTIDQNIFDLQIYKLEKFIFDEEKRNFNMILALFFKFAGKLRKAINDFYTSICNQKEQMFFPIS